MSEEKRVWLSGIEGRMETPSEEDAMAGGAKRR